MRQRVALVSGSSRGLGRAIARQLAAAGARVAINYAHDDAAAQNALKEISAIGEAHLFKGDAMSEKGVKKLVAAVSKQLGPIEILVINATPAQPNCPLEQYSEKDFRSMLDAFVMSPHYLTREVVGPMKNAGFGRIIHITSEVFHRPQANFAAYISAKGGQVGYMRSSAVELAPHGITVNEVAPGWIPVERHEKWPQSAIDSYRQSVPMGRMGTPEEVAAAVCFLASDEAAFLTGQSVALNGGRSIR